MLLVSGLLGLAGAVGARAQGVPLVMNYQGVLTDGHGQPMAGDNLTVNFRVFGAEKGGTMIWGTRQLVTTDSNGVFNVLLGQGGQNVPGASNQVNSLLEVFSGVNADKRWLEVEVEHNLTSAMSPRQRFATVPYSYQAGNASGCAGDFTVGSVLTVQSNAYLQQGLNITDSGQESLVFNNTVYDSAGLTVSQKVVVATPMIVDGAFAVHGNAVFSNDTTFTQSVEFDGPAYFSHGVSLRGNTSAFGSFSQLASKGPDGSTHTDSGTVAANGFLIVRMITNDHDSGNTLTFTLNGQQLEFRADWSTDGSDALHYQDSTTFPVKAGSSWTISCGGGNIGYAVLYRSIP
ncbi:MAG TPA: hypothetical protein DCZ95_18320 [Verrucomicrobia bacterium]|nr:MAG: hypothetical protein A2X46_16470 [Lentisphaerae bacterium GWF2_57_35]HBA86045.1 hypothetical protein [Verrucomicrobiota bacterium]